MFEPVSGAFAGVRMFWEGIKWAWKSKQAPWSALPATAHLSKHSAPWHLKRDDFNLNRFGIPKSLGF